MAETNAKPSNRVEQKLDDMLDDTFPASDPPSTTPIGGTRKSAEIAAAHEQPGPDDEPAGHAKPHATPTDDRHATETAAARVHGVDPAETDDRSGE